MSWTGIGKKAADFAEVASALGSKVKKTVTKKADQPASGQVPDEFSRGGSNSASSVKQGANLPKDTVTQIQDTEQLLRAPGILEGQVRNMNLDFLKKKEIEILTASGRKADAKALEKMSVADYDARFKARTDSIVPAEESPKAAAASTQADDADARRSDVIGRPT